MDPPGSSKVFITKRRGVGRRFCLGGPEKEKKEKKEKEEETNGQVVSLASK